MFRYAAKSEAVIKTGYRNRGNGKVRTSVKADHPTSQDASAVINGSIMSKFTVFGITAFSFIIILASCLLFNTNANEAANSLRLVIAVFRHGERTPASTYIKDPHINNDFFPMGWGALTNEGKKNQYEIGKLLRGRYKSFLSEIYSPKYVVAQSTDVDRTKMSMQLVLAGLYPPAKAQQWNTDLNWQPIPFKYEPLSEDKLLLVNVPCPRYYEAFQEVEQSKEVEQLIKQNGPIYKLLTNETGMEVKTFNDLLSIQGTLKAEIDLNLKLPNWTKEVYPSPLNQLAGKAFTLNVYTPELIRIKGGPLLKRILKHLTDKIEEKSHKTDQLYLYAGHDSTIANLLNALGVWEEHAPEYNALIVLELHELKDNSHGVKVLFRKSKDDHLKTLEIPGCGEICPLQYIKEYTRGVIPTDLTEHCKPKDPNYEQPEPPEI